MSGKMRVAALSMALVCLLAGCGKKKDKEKEKLPEAYLIGEESIAALTVEDEEVKLAEQKEESHPYTYEGLSDAGGTVSGYVTQMTGEENGFRVVNEDFMQSDLPDFTAAEGAVTLAKSGAEEGTLLTLQLSWAEGTCTILPGTAEGTITAQPEGMDAIEALDYFSSLPPAVLGLAGSSMEAYEVYIQDGAVMVDGAPCLRLNVYSKDNPEETNDLQGIYLMTSDGLHVYQVNEGEKNVTELDL